MCNHNGSWSLSYIKGNIVWCVVMMAIIFPRQYLCIRIPFYSHILSTLHPICVSEKITLPMRVAQLLSLLYYVLLLRTMNVTKVK